MNKLFKISSMVAIAALVAFNTYMASDILKSNGTDLASVFGLSEVMAEQDDGGETGDEILVKCYEEYDEAVWWWDDDYKRACKNPEQVSCAMFYGNDWELENECWTTM